jgi:putative peptidoglycan lipid II flippase
LAFQLSNSVQALFRRGIASRMVSGFMVVAMLTVGSKAVSFFKDAAVAHQFGTGDALDAFMLSFGFLSFAAALLGGGLPEAFLPAYAQTVHRHHARRAHRLALQCSLIHAGSLLIVAAVLYVIAPWLVANVTHGFNAEKQRLATNLVRHLLPFLLCFGMSYQLGTWLRADKCFTVATSAPILVPLTIIAFIAVAGKGTTVDTLVYGTVTGAALHLLLLLYVVASRLPKQGRFYRHALRLWEPQAKTVAKNALPFLFAGGIFSSAVVVDQTMAAWLEPGSVAVLGYADKVCGIILAVTAAPACDVLFPYFADKVARLDWLGVRKQLFTSAITILAMALPATLILCWLAPWVIHVLFERGSFTSQDTERVAAVLRFSALQIPFYILGSLASRVVVAMQATKFIVILSAVGLIANVVLNAILMRTKGVAGIALATVLVQMMSAGFGYLYVLRQIKARLQAE